MKLERIAFAAGASLLGLAILVGCASFPTMTMPPKEAAASDAGAPSTPAPGRGGDAGRGQPTPMQIPGGAQTAPTVPEATPEQLAALIANEPLNATLPPQPLAQFLNTVFADVLKVPYALGPGLGARSEIITVNAPATLNKQAFVRLLQATLRGYGLTMSVRGGAIQITEEGVPVGGGGRGGAQVVRSRSASDTPAGNRQVIQFFQLVALQADAVAPFVNDTLLRGSGVTVSADGAANALVLSGSARAVAGAVDALRNLDKPAFAGSQVVRLEPVFWAPDLFAQTLAQALQAEGYVVATDPLGPKSIMILPLPSTNQTLVFAADRETMNRVLYWARELDQPSSVGDVATTYVYDVKNISAASVGAMVVNAASVAPQGAGRGGNPIINAQGLPGGGNQGGRGGAQQQQQNQGGRGGGGVQQQIQQLQQQFGAAAGGGAGRGGQTQGRPGQVISGGAPGGGAITVDDVGNRILFTGSASQFAALRSLLQRLDQPAREVVVEVTVAEVTLTDETRSGVEFFFDILNTRGGVLSGGTMGQTTGTPRGPGASTLNRGTQGLNLFFDRVGDYQVAINALASNNKVNVLSRPRLVARSGAQAYIQVGANVPIVIGQRAVNTGNTDTSADVTQQIQYRDTGVILNITPVVYGDDRVDILISQEVSSARDNPNPSIQSPIIDVREVSTTLSLADGQMAVLGGLIEDSYSKGNTGIPFLKDIPILGYPFRVDSISGRKTELVILVTPFIIRNDEDMSNIAGQMAREVNEAFAVGRGGSYTLTPFAGGASLGLNPPNPRVSGAGLRRPDAKPED